MATGPSIRRLGILGGTFNPPHLGHLAAAGIAREALELDLVLLVTSGDSPHKRPEVPASQRHAMARLAVRGREGLAAAPDPGETGYTVDTLKALKEQYPQASLHLITGGDVLGDMAGWRGAGELFRLAEIVAVPRHGAVRTGQAAEYLRSQSASLRLLCRFPPDISSSQIRQRIRDAQPTGNLLPQPVEAHIYTTGLYLPKEIRAQLISMADILNVDERKHILHALGVGINLNADQGVSGPQLRQAILLHGCPALAEGPEQPDPEVTQTLSQCAANTPDSPLAKLVLQAYRIAEQENI